jgi:glucose-1-phosphate thymidylyltransferase
MGVKGLVCAGGEATRLGELTAITNKHLLPVGRWPMVYYPLELLQKAGVHEVLIVTGQQHGGDFIRLLGDGRRRSRGGGDLIFDLDLTYKVQAEAGGIAQVVAMAEGFAAGDKLIVCLGDNIFQYAEVDALRDFVERQDRGARIFLKDVPDPERFGVPAFDDDGRVCALVEKPGVLDRSYSEPPSRYAVVGLYAFDASVFDIIRTLEPSERGELEITDVNRAYLERGELTHSFVGGWWKDAGTHESLAQIGSLIEQTGANLLPTPATPQFG